LKRDGTAEDSSCAAFEAPPATMSAGAIEDEASQRPTLRVVVTGDAGAGKTALIRRYVNNYFPRKPSTTHATAGLDHAVKLIQLPGGGPKDATTALLHISEDDATESGGWGDVARSPATAAFGYHRAEKCQRASGALMVFDGAAATDDALRRVARRKSEFDADVTFRSGDGLPVVLVATKADVLESESDAAPDDDARRPATHNNGRRPPVTLDASAMDLFCVNNNFVASIAASHRRSTLGFFTASAQSQK